ncbi:hypothetical protein ARHIZOSPH14_19070 [Agromyces rhizosphaerae]|uniref:Uncharacterized protein n=1 Tax=Agromyces rhizosphaerae TaxID=88374 RepID=A0A9W6CXW0_9MICO|nr:hypothetical protein [Agromyces rhizosphaerae]GLI27665.1 hypothetical protein ARHIZOSPH14_19070 [Agromyces rhizosphaerae]
MHDAADAPRTPHYRRIDEPTGLTRRALARSAAWSVPAIAVAATVPTVAASAEAPAVAVRFPLFSCSTIPEFHAEIATDPIPVGARFLISVTTDEDLGLISAGIPALGIDLTSGPATVTGTGAAFAETIDISVAMDLEGRGTLLVSVSALSGMTFTGTTVRGAYLLRPASTGWECCC